MKDAFKLENVLEKAEIREATPDDLIDDTLYVYDFDLDGSLFNKECLKRNQYLASDLNNDIEDLYLERTKNLIDSNPLLWRTINTDENIIFLNSNRQDYETDYFNDQNCKQNTGSCVHALEAVYAHLKKQHPKTQCDTFLMADLYGSLKSGGTFEAIKNKWEKNQSSDFAQSKFDKSKTSTLYAHVHKVASEHPDKKNIALNFYDDRPEILNAIFRLYSTYSNLIPKNVVIHLFHYDGTESPTLWYINDKMGFIQGKGEVDYAYRDTICEWSRECTPSSSGSYDFSQTIPAIAFKESQFETTDQEISCEKLQEPSRHSFFQPFVNDEISHQESLLLTRAQQESLDNLEKTVHFRYIASDQRVLNALKNIDTGLIPYNVSITLCVAGNEQHSSELLEGTGLLPEPYFEIVKSKG